MNDWADKAAERITLDFLPDLSPEAEQKARQQIALLVRDYCPDPAPLVKKAAQARATISRCATETACVTAALDTLAAKLDELVKGPRGRGKQKKT